MDNNNSYANYWCSSQNVKITILPFFDHGWGFELLEMHEIIGGKIAEGSIHLIDNGSKESSELIYSTQKLDIIIDSPGRLLEIKNAIIINKQYDKNYLTIEFICIPDHSFILNPVYKTWDSIDTAMFSSNGLFTNGKIDKRCDSQIGQGLKIIQKGETNHELLCKLGYSYKEKTTFAIGLEGFFIKDLPGTDSLGQKEPYWSIIDSGDEIQESKENVTYDQNLYQTYEDISSSSINISSIKLGDRYCLISKETSKLAMNYMYNTNLMSSKFYRTIRTSHTNSLPEYKLGDVLYYIKRSDPISGNLGNVYFVSEMSYYISNGKYKDSGGSKFVVHSVLRGLQENNTYYNNQNPYDTI